MKKTKFRFILVAAVGLISVAGITTIISSKFSQLAMSENKINNVQPLKSNQEAYLPPANSDFNHQNFLLNSEPTENIKKQYSTQSTANSRIINNIEIYKPILSGPQNLWVEQNLEFDPHDYNFLVYDQFGEYNSSKIEFSKIDTSQTGEKNLTATFKSKFNFLVTKTFKVKVVDSTTYKKVNGTTETYEYDAYVNNSNLQQQVNVGGDFGLSTSWQLTIPTPIYYGDNVTIKQISDAYYQKYKGTSTFMLPIGQAYKNGASTYDQSHAKPVYFDVDSDPNKPKTFSLNKTSNPLSGPLLLRTKAFEGSQIPPEFQITITRGNESEASTNNPINRVRRLPYYLHKFTKASSFANYWNTVQNSTGAIVQNDVALLTPSVIDFKQWIDLDKSNKVNLVKTQKNLEEKSARNEFVIWQYQYMNGFDETLADKNNLRFNVNIVFLTSYSNNNSVGWVDGRVVTANWARGKGSINNFINTNLLYVHEVGHIFQAGNTNNGTNYDETTNMLFGQYIYWVDLQNKWLKQHQTFSQEAYNTAKKSWFTESTSQTNVGQLGWDQSSKMLLEQTQYNDNFYKSIDLYDYLRRFIFVNIFATAGWETYRQFNILWRRIANQSLVIPNLTNKDPAENFFYMAIGLTTKYDTSFYFKRMGLPIKPSLVEFGVFSGWRSLSMIAEVNPINKTEIIKKSGVINDVSLVENSAYSVKNTGELDLRIQGINQNQLPDESFQIVDNKNGEFHVLKNFQVAALNTKIQLPIGSYFLIAPQSKNKAYAHIIPIDVKLAFSSSYVINYQRKNQQSERLDINQMMNNLELKFNSLRNRLISFQTQATSDGLAINYFQPPTNNSDVQILFHNSYPKDNVYFSYKLSDQAGKVIDTNEFQNNGQSKNKFVLNKNGQVTSEHQLLATKSTSSFGEINYSPVNDFIKLDFSNNQKYRFTIFFQHLTSLKFFNSFFGFQYGNKDTVFNGVPLAKYQNNYTSTYGDNPSSKGFNTSNWNEEQKKAHTIDFTVSQSGLNLGWHNSSDSNDGFYNTETKSSMGFSDAQKQLMASQTKSAILIDVKNTLVLFKNFNPTIIKNPNNFVEKKQFLQIFKNSDLLQEFQKSNQLSANEINELNDVLIANSLKKSLDNPSETVLKNSELLDNFSSVFANNKYYNTQNQLVLPGWKNVMQTDFPVGLKTVTPGVYTMEFEVKEQGQVLQWTAQIRVVS